MWSNPQPYWLGRIDADVGPAKAGVGSGSLSSLG